MYISMQYSHTYQFYGVCCMMQELSAGFTSVGSMLNACGLGTHPLWFINQVRSVEGSDMWPAFLRHS